MSKAGKLEGKLVLITGAARRIGRALALAAASEGAKVAITYWTSQRDAEDTIERLQELDADAIAIRCDVRDPLNVAEAVQTTADDFGGIDVLINNAGIFETVDFGDITPENWDNMFATNARGPFLFSRASLPWLRRRRGRIINIGSLGGLRPWPTHAHYCSSKAAVVMLTQVMAKALAPQIAVNCIAPGMISMGESRDPEYVRRIIRNTPMQRAGSAQDVAEAALFFATATHFIKGQILAVDGGLGL
jgi:3-oxoacyl-[acyl-carrier protein] reductase/pteridine reductase